MSDTGIPEEVAVTLEPAADEPEPQTGARRMVLNMGPQHPSTHGVLRLLLELDGETIVKCQPDIGYLHTGIEKEFEVKNYQQGVTLTDRVDYLAPLSNNLAYCLAVEKLLGLEIPPQAQWMRVMLTELTRLNSHLVWLATHAIDIGAMSVFLYCFREREEILKIFEMFSGQRMMTSYFRIGGLALEPPRGWQQRVKKFIDIFPSRIDEMRQSTRIIRQAMDGMPSGDWKADAPHVVLPDREKMKTQMEALIFHFKIVTEGFRVPEGEVFQVIESPRGELGYYMVSDGTAKPYRVHIHGPSFGNLQGLPKMIEGLLISDVIASLGSMDFVLGDTDR